MRRFCLCFATFALALSLRAGTALAGATAYDVDVLLHRTHPFADSPGGGSGESQLPRSQLYPPARVPVASAAGLAGRPAAAPSAGDIRPRVAQLAPSEGHDSDAPLVSEIRAGLLVHDQGPFSSNEEEGYDTNLEILFSSPDFLDFVWSPRPHIGADINLSGDTSEFYFGLSWEWSFWRSWFAGFSLGGALHDGKLKTDRADRKELGCRLLFRESVEAGYRFNGRHSVSLFLDHISNARLCSKNEGLENFGVRYGYRF